MQRCRRFFTFYARRQRSYKIANEISTVPDLMSGAISARLTTEIVDGKATTRVLDQDGKPSALTVEELKKEFVANEKFSSIIVGSNASGSGAMVAEMEAVLLRNSAKCRKLIEYLYTRTLQRTIANFVIKSRHLLNDLTT